MTPRYRESDEKVFYSLVLILQLFYRPLERQL